MTLEATKATDEVDTTTTVKTVADESIDDLTDEELTILDQERKKAEAEEAIANKNKTKSYISQLRDNVSEERKAKEDAIKERDDLKRQNEIDLACANFGEDIINSDEVKGYKEKHPYLTYDECVKLAGFEPKQTAKQSFMGRARKYAGDTKSYKMEDMEKMDSVQRKEVMRMSRNGQAIIT